MKNLSGHAERLRMVRKAQEQFLARFALECIWNQSHAYDRLAEDMASIDGPMESESAFSRRVLDR